MAQAPLRWGTYPLADPIWWAEQQLKVMTATTTYLTRVTQAMAATTTAPPAIETGPAPAGAAEPSAPAVAPAPIPPAPAPLAPEPELPVAGWDKLSLGSIRARLSRLSEADLVSLQAYEERHGGRPDVVSMLANRLIRVRAAHGPAGSAG